MIIDANIQRKVTFILLNNIINYFLMKLVIN